MKISVCIPTLGNRVPMLANFLRSLSCQTHRDFEVCFNDEPIGIFPALNKAIANSSGSILYFGCDDDEIAGDDVFAFVNEQFSGHSDKPMWIYGRGELIDEHGSLICQSHKKETSYEEMLQHNAIFQPSVFWNRAMQNAAGGFNELWSHSSDYAQWLKFWRIAEPVFVDRILSRYRIWDQTHTSQNAQAQLEESQSIAEMFRAAR